MKTEHGDYGLVQIDQNHTFYWTNAHGEIHGHIERKLGGIVRGTSGWYRTDDHSVAEKIARQRLDALSSQ